MLLDYLFVLKQHKSTNDRKKGLFKKKMQISSKRITGNVFFLNDTFAQVCPPSPVKK